MLLLVRWGVWLLLLVQFHHLVAVKSPSDSDTGGQYHWVSEFSPRKYQRGLSYIVGTYFIGKAQTGWWLALTAYRLAWSVGLGSRRCLLELLSRNTDTRFVFDCNHCGDLVVQVLMHGATGLLVLNYPESYVFKSWHGTLLTMAILCLSVTFNTFLAQKLHLVVTIAELDLRFQS